MTRQGVGTNGSLSLNRLMMVRISPMWVMTREGIFHKRNSSVRRSRPRPRSQFHASSSRPRALEQPTTRSQDAMRLAQRGGGVRDRAQAEGKHDRVELASSNGSCPLAAR
jgi:hypothetical protein